MSIWLNEQSKILIQGITGKNGRFHTEHMLEYGTNIVAGVTPGKGGGATPEQISEGFRIILSDSEVKAIFVNIFGGIMRCDFVAEGIISAAKNVELNIPLIVRLSGTNAELGRDLLNNSDLELIAVSDMDEGARQAISSLEVSK